MIVIGRQFPDFSSPGYELDSPCPIFGWPTAVLRAFSTQHEYPDHQTAFTLLTNFGGQARYISKQRETILDEREVLVMLPGERFSSIVDADKPVESVYIVFRDDDVAAALSRDDLDPIPSRTSLPQTFRKISPRDYIGRIRALVANNADVEHIEEALLSMLDRMIIEYWPKVDRTMRPATVVERRKRMEIARERIHAEFDRGLTLDDLSGTACLSNYHFLRLFKEAFGVTPHQYLSDLRLNRAKELLLTSDERVHQIAKSVGFASSTSFIAKYRNKFGESPGNSRKQD